MYRIIYSTKACGWVIQIRTYIFFWSSINKSTYNNYNDAKEHVDSIGLDKIYANHHDVHHIENTHEVSCGGSSGVVLHKHGVDCFLEALNRLANNLEALKEK